MQTKRIQQPVKMHVLYTSKHHFGHCRRGSKLRHGYVPGDRLRDDIRRFKKNPIIFIFHLRIYFAAFLIVAAYTS